MADPKRKIVLFIDDDEDDFFLLRDIFKECHEGIELRWAKDGEEAMERLMRRDGQEDSTPSLILLDLNMPKLNGREVLRQIRDHNELQHIPVVMLTNSMNKDEAIDAYRLGANSFIRKPSGYKELREFIKTFTQYWFEYSTLI